MELSPHCEWWTPNSAVELLDGQRECLQTLFDAGLAPFIGPSYLLGAMTPVRTALIVHRGSGRYWELCLRDGEAFVAERFTNDLGATGRAVVAWLKGDSTDDVLLALAPNIIAKPGTKPQSHTL